VTASAAVVAERHTPGEAGLWILLFGDMTVFAIVFGAYLQQRGRQPDLFAHAQEALSRDIGAANTVILLTSSFLVVRATRGTGDSLNRHSPRLLAGAILLGLAFVGLKAWEYTDLVAGGITPHTSTFFMYYFALTGLHLAHLTVGLVVLIALFMLSRRQRLTTAQFAFAEGGACFWHMVDLLWLIIFPLVFLVR
jgi:nitric oxide reductase NorE protein